MRIQVGDWLADDAADTLQRGGERRKLERRAMAVLMELARRPGEVLSRDELVLAVWGRHAISDHSVAIVISDLRRAFGDDRGEPRYIETITKRGYRLVAPDSDAPTPAEAGSRPPARRALLAGGV